MAVDKDDIIAKDRLLLQERRNSLEDVCKDISEYIVPNRGRFPDDDRKPDKSHGARGDKIIDSTQCDAHEIAYNGMFSGLTPPSRPWHHTKFEDDDLNKYGPAKEFMDALGKRRNNVLRRSNFYTAIHSAFAEVLAFSNALIYMREFDQGGFAFRCFTFGEYCWSRGASGQIDTVYRHEWMSAKNLVQEFGIDKVSNQVRDAIRNNKPYSYFEVLHAVEPRVIRDPGKRDAKNKPYQSIWMEISSDKNILREGGFDDFPYAGASWLLVGSDNYGTDCPGAKALPDIKMLQDMEESCLMATHKELDPAILAPSSMRGKPIKKSAGGITYYDGQAEGLKRLYEFQFDLNAGEAKSEAIRQRIRKHFKNDIFMMISAAEMSGGKQPLTATQISIMDANNKTQIGPFIERLEDSPLDPTIIFVTQRMLARPWLYSLPMPPQEIQGQSYKVEYVSLLAQAQQMVGVQSINEGLAFAAQAVQLDPEIIDVYDFDEIAREHADLVGLSAKLVHSQDEVDAIRSARLERQQALQAQQEAILAAQGAKTLSETKTNPDDPNALTDLSQMAAEGMMQ